MALETSGQSRRLRIDVQPLKDQGSNTEMPAASNSPGMHRTSS